jgi:hypothetical protein
MVILRELLCLGCMALAFYAESQQLRSRSQSSQISYQIPKPGWQRCSLRRSARHAGSRLAQQRSEMSDPSGVGSDPRAVSDLRIEACFDSFEAWRIQIFSLPMTLCLHFGLRLADGNCKSSRAKSVLRCGPASTKKATFCFA